MLSNSLAAAARQAGLTSQAEHAVAALDACGFGVLTLDDALRPVLINAVLAALLELPPGAVSRAADLSALLALSPLLDAAAIHGVRTLCTRVEDGPAELHAELRLGGRTLALRAVALPDDGLMLAVHEPQAAAGAATDPLTGLPTRDVYARCLRERLASSPDVLGAVLLVALDRFKEVNDTLGHAAGDALLGMVAKRLRGCVRQHDLVARFGGDEFALLVAPALGPDEVRDQVRRVLDTLSRPYRVDGQLVTVGARAGVALFPADARAPEQLLRAADLALREAKGTGAGQIVFFREEFESRARRRRLLAADLREALSLGHFELHYQPQIGLRTGAITGFEALLRWRRHGHDLVSPLDFIPLAEDTGLIVPIGAWVIRQAAAEAATWPNDLSVSVNVSPRQFADPAELVASIAGALAESGLPGRRFVVEITESAILRDRDAVLDVLNGLRALGVRSAMDDFGTGYSSLSQLHSFPFDEIKIDRSFIRDRHEPAGQQAIIRAIAALGAGLGMSTVAEGVETAAQLDRMVQSGCTSVQGFLFSRPVPAAEARRLIARFPAP